MVGWFYTPKNTIFDMVFAKIYPEFIEVYTYKPPYFLLIH